MFLGTIVQQVSQIVANIAIGLLSAVSPHQTPATSCGTFQDIEYCYYAGAPNNHQVIYFMHGFGNDVTGWTWNAVDGRIEKAWEERGIEKPNIVSMSRHVWWYTEKQNGEYLNSFVTWFESSILKFQADDRVLYGDSMGAHNAYRWAVDFPEQFHRLLLICPAIPKSFVHDNPMSQGPAPWAPFAELLVHEAYKNSSQPDFNPLSPPNDDPIRMPGKVHIISSTSDEFGFYAGGYALAQALARNPQTQVTFETQAVTHCGPDVTQMVDFLVQR